MSHWFLKDALKRPVGYIKHSWGGPDLINHPSIIISYSMQRIYSALFGCRASQPRPQTVATMNRTAVWRRLEAWVWIGCHAKFASSLEKFTLALDNMQGGMFQVLYHRPHVNPDEGVLVVVKGMVESGKEWKFCRKTALNTVTTLYNREVTRQGRTRRSKGGWG